VKKIIEKREVCMKIISFSQAFSYFYNGVEEIERRQKEYFFQKTVLKIYAPYNTI